MDFSIAVLAGVGATSLILFIFSSKKNKKTIKSRIQEKPQTPKLISKPSIISSFKYNESGQKSDKLARDLFIAGFRKTVVTENINLLLQLNVLFFVTAMAIIAIRFDNNLYYYMYAIVGCILFRLGVFEWVKFKIRRRQDNIKLELPQFLDLLVVSLESGMNFMSAIPIILKEFPENSNLSQEFSVMHHEYVSGLSLGESCERLSQRCKVNNLSIVLGNIIQAEKLGTSLGSTLRVLASELRETHKLAMREKAIKVPTLLILPTCFIFMAMIIVSLGPSMSALISSLSDITSSIITS